MPQYPAPVYPTWGASAAGAVDRTFDGIMQGMQQAQQQKMAQTALLGQNALQSGFNPQSVIGGQKVANQFPGQQLGQVPPGQMSQLPPGTQGPINAQPVPAGQPFNASAGQPVMGQQQISPGQADMYQQFQSLLGSNKQRTQAQTADIQSQTNLRNAQATYNQNRPTTPGGGAGSANNMTPDEWKALTDAAYAHPDRFPSDLLTSRGPKSKFIAQQVMKNPDYDPTTTNISYGAAKSGAASSSRLTEGGSSQVVARTANSAKEQLGILQQVSQDFPRSDIQAMNTPIIAIDKQTYPNAQNWITAVNSVRYEYATALARGNKPGDQDLSEASKALPDNITPAQLDAVIPLMNNLIDATVKGQMTAVPAPKIPDAAPAQHQGAAPMSAPGSQPAQKPQSKQQKPAAKGGQRQVQLIGPNGQPRTANYNGKKFMGWADGGQ